MIAKPPGHSAGSATTALSGTVQRRFVCAPHATMTAATGRRTISGIGRAGQGGSVPACSKSIETQPIHCVGMVTSVTATIAPVTPSAIPRLRHSRRTANQMRPIPGVSFVNRTTAQAPG